jgi:hypothetical protein
VTDWEPETIPDANGCISPDAVCHALALALVEARPGWPGVRLRVLPCCRGEQTEADDSSPLDSVSRLRDLLARVGEERAKTVVRPLDAGGWIELSKGAVSTNGLWAGNGQPSANGAPLALQPSGVGTESKR